MDTKRGGKEGAVKRTLTVLRRPLGDRPGRVRISVRRGSRDLLCEYDFAHRAAEGGTHFRLKKDDGSVYDVLLAGRERSCDCMGFLRHGHCKHIPCCFTLAGLCPPSGDEGER